MRHTRPTDGGDAPRPPRPGSDRLGRWLLVLIAVLAGLIAAVIALLVVGSRVGFVK